MPMLRALLVVFSLFAFAGAAEARKAELVDPAPVAIPAGLDQQLVAKEIKRTLLTRGWVVSAEQPGQIESTLNLRDHVARIRVTYDASQVRFAYVDSTNLDYVQKRGKTYIHSNYLGWVGFLINDLTANLAVTALDA